MRDKLISLGASSVFILPIRNGNADNNNDDDAKTKVTFSSLFEVSF